MAGINDLGAIRERLNWTQQRMADALDIGLRTYVDAEASDKPRKAYLLAAQYLASLDPNYSFDCALPMKDSKDEERAQTAAALYVAKAALEIVLSDPSNIDKGFGRSAYLYDESCAADVDLISRRGAYLAGEIVHTLAIELQEHKSS